MQNDRPVMDGSKSQCRIWGQIVRAGKTALLNQAFFATGAYLEEATVHWLGVGTYCKRQLRQEPAVSSRTDSLTAWWGIATSPRLSTDKPLYWLTNICRHQCSHECRTRSWGFFFSPAALWETLWRTCCTTGIFSTTPHVIQTRSTHFNELMLPEK